MKVYLKRKQKTSYSKTISFFFMQVFLKISKKVHKKLLCFVVVSSWKTMHSLIMSDERHFFRFLK